MGDNSSSSTTSTTAAPTTMITSTTNLYESPNTLQSSDNPSVLIILVHLVQFDLAGLQKNFGF